MGKVRLAISGTTSLTHLLPAPITARVTSAERIKDGYERRPYPGTDLGRLIKKGGSLPALKWMLALGRPGRPAPSRVLIAGCGTGVEAFILRQRLPKAEIVAVDFSPRSIATADRLQRTSRPKRPITFLAADLADPGLAERTGGHFDLISCHGVLSYVPDPSPVLKNLAACLSPGGAVYLGVNGGAHPATALRPWLAGFGLAVDALKDERRLRELLGLWDTLHDEGGGELATMSASYLASDICGAHFNNWPLDQWRTAANRAGLEIAGTDILPMALRLTMDRDQHRFFFPGSPGEVAARMDQLRPAGFHRIMLRPVETGGLIQAFDRTPGQSVQWTDLYSARFRKSNGGRTMIVVLSCAIFHLRLEWTLTLAQTKSLLQLIETGVASAADLKPWTRTEAGRRLLWLWSALGAIAVNAPTRA